MKRADVCISAGLRQSAASGLSVVWVSITTSDSPNSQSRVKMADKTLQQRDTSKEVKHTSVDASVQLLCS